MRRELFAERLREAAVVARDFARTFVEEELPDEVRFRVCLNSSYDAAPLTGDEVVFPEDSELHRTESLSDCNEEQVLQALWRGGRVPEWIDVSVIAAAGVSTMVQLLCCGRFTAADERLYHQPEGRAPFHVLGPALPVPYNPGQRFSIFHRTQCWQLRDLIRIKPHSHKVWSLELLGYSFDDSSQQLLPDLPEMEILELSRSSLGGSGLVELARFPKLRVLRISLERNDSFRLPRMPILPNLDVLEISELPPRPWGFGDFAAGLPNLSWLSLRSRGELVVDGDCPPNLKSLSISGTRLVGGLKPPASIETISAHLSQATDAEVQAWLAPNARIDGLDLSGTPITDALAERLPARFALAYLNVVNTKVREGAIERIREAHPTMKLVSSVAPPIL